ncbi:MAG: phospholipid carrier-dependent glycosyltransferase [Anaerolineae bacterium]|nr:phospholipid carrier-dependent glycosyltransferase [Anaerolineae bacterium]MBT7074890.1 phospholipid carrier-dependent glycosyltransferase [Anaerolineae bacterium]MBT7781827.1 phospholipid carrier-dependent glycosyltransferase [Anaerolineae bacterium]
MTKKNSRFWDRKAAYALVLGLLTVSGAWLLAISTPHGLGLTDDAISYIASSRALLAGDGFTRIWLATGLKPITHWPPFYPFSLAFISTILKTDPYRSARVLNILVFGANAGVLALFGYKMTKSQFMGVLLSILFLSNTAFLRLHAQALSEPLYILISLVAFLAFYEAFKSDAKKELTWLFITGIITGITYITRYAALSLIATFIVAILILFPTWKKRLLSLGYFLAGVLPFVLAWSLRNTLVGGTATNRAILWHPITLENAQRGLKSFFLFFLPRFEPPEYFILAAIFLLILLSLLLWVLPNGIRYFLKPKENKRPEILPFITVLYIFSYLGSLMVSLAFFDAATPLNDRILSPVYLALLIILLYFAHKLFEQGKITSRILVTSLILFLLITSFISQNRTVAELQETATGFASWRWNESTVMEAIRNLPDEIITYTNQPPAVYFWTGRAPLRLWDEQPEDVRSGAAVLAIFYPPERKTPKFQAWLAEMTEGLEPIEKSGLGNLYQKKD